MSENISDNRVYEIGFLVLPTIAEEKVPEVAGGLRAAIEAAGGAIISDEAPRMIRLAYVMEKVIDNKKQKFDTASFGWVKFELDPASLEELQKTFEGTKEVLRALTIKTTREAATAGRRMAMAPTWTRKREEKVLEATASAPAMATEEIDKKIEELAI